MKVTLKFFAMLKSQIGTEEKVFDTHSPLTAGEIFLNYFDPKFLPFTRFAVNWEYVPGDTVVNDGDELAFIPPVSGG